MFTDYFDVGIMVEDRQAARVVSHAIDGDCRPVFQNACGPFLEVFFTPPLPPPTSAAVMADTPKGEALTPPAEAPSSPLLYGWIEQVPADTILQVIRTTTNSETECQASLPGEEPPEQPCQSPPSSSSFGVPLPTTTTGVTEAQVCGQMNFVLHLWSTPHASRGMHVHTDSKEGSAHVDFATAETATPEEGGGFFTATGEEVVLSDPHDRELELRDDRQMVSAAMDTIVMVGRLLKENPSATVSCSRNESDGSEVLRFA